MKTTKQVSFGFGVGLLVSALGFGAYRGGSAFANSASPPAGNCQVEIGFGSPSGSGQCFQGEVVTRIQAGTVYCSRISVSCPNNPAVIPTTEDRHPL